MRPLARRASAYRPANPPGSSGPYGADALDSTPFAGATMTTGDLIRGFTAAKGHKGETASALTAAQVADSDAATALASADAAVTTDLAANGPAVDVSVDPPVLYQPSPDGKDFTASVIRRTDPTPAPAPTA